MYNSNENDSCNCQIHPAVVHHTAMRDQTRCDVAAHQTHMLTAVPKIIHQEALF